MPARTRFETSAGGLVLRATESVWHAALIGRTARSGELRWSLPKGHVERGETLEQTAIREIAEETGITGRVVARLGSFDYTFRSTGRRIHKRVHHFLLRAEAGELSDADPEVTEVAWVPLDKLDSVLAFSAERRLVRKAGDLLAGFE